MTETTRTPAARVGVDLSKHMFQALSEDNSGRVVQASAMSPARFFTCWGWMRGL